MKLLWTCFSICVVAASFCWVPYRTTGSWTLWGTGSPSASIQSDLDLRHFGRRPHYVFAPGLHTTTMFAEFESEKASDGKTYWLASYESSPVWGLWVSQILATVFVLLTITPLVLGGYSNANDKPG